jgi:hypothetical protein
MAGRPRKVDTSETESLTSGDTSSSEYHLTISYEYKKDFSYGVDRSHVVVYAVLKYDDEVIADERFNYDEYVEDAVKRWAQYKKLFNEARLENLKPKTLDFEED